MRRLLIQISRWIFQPHLHKPQYRLEEDEIPVDARGKPDISRYTKPLDYYIALYESSLARPARRDLEQSSFLFRKRVHATWGLLAKGSSAIPYLLHLMQHTSPDAREDASHLLGELKDQAGVADVLLHHMENETDLVARSAMIDALGKLRYQPAIPALARVIVTTTGDQDLRLDAADSLSRIVGVNFSESGDAVRSASKWLREHNYYPGGGLVSKE